MWSTRIPLRHHQRFSRSALSEEVTDLGASQLAKWVTLFAITLTWVNGSVAQVMVSPEFTKEERQKRATDAADLEMLLSPAQEPVPALRHRLWPSPEDRRPASPMAMFHRAMMRSVEQRRRFDVQAHDALAETPIVQLDSPEANEFVDSYCRYVVEELRRGENLMRIDYDLNLQRESTAGVVSFLLPEIQEARSLARRVALSARLALAQGRHDDAVADLRVGFRLAQITGRSTDFAVGRLVGFAITELMLGVVEEAIQIDGCPNLYWALASLPIEELTETQRAIEQESLWIRRVAGLSENLPDSAIGEHESRRLLKRFADDVEQIIPKPSGRSRLAQRQLIDFAAGIIVVGTSESAREYLAQETGWGEKANQLSAPEAVLRTMQVKAQRLSNESEKWSYLPEDVAAQASDFDPRSIPASSHLDVLSELARVLQPAIKSVRKSSNRVQQVHHWLVTIEAIRMHASRYGTLPDTLETLRPVPAWLDPLTGEAFLYKKLSPSQASLSRTGSSPVMLRMNPSSAD
ncbi:MAG: hypothetical protein AAGA03_13375 [Planctomycetota bacterium]